MTATPADIATMDSGASSAIEELIEEHIVDISAALHETLLRLSGSVPDDLIVAARTWLAEGSLSEVARAATYAVVTYRIPLLDRDFVALAAVLAESAAEDEDDDDPLSWLDRVEVTAAVGAPSVRFVPTLDGTTGEPDAVDRAATEAVVVEPGARGLWRTWRMPRIGSPWPPPQRVFVVEVDADPSTLPEVTHRLQRRLAEAGESTPQVEVYPIASERPMPYQRQAQMWSDLLWAAAELPKLHLAVVCDEVDEDGQASFPVDHPTVAEDDERTRMVEYLLAGTPLLVADRATGDVVDPARGEVVPMNLRTDGTWIWSEASAYYLAEHGLAPDPGLMGHLESVPGTAPVVDDATFQRILEWLDESPDGSVA